MSKTWSFLFQTLVLLAPLLPFTAQSAAKKKPEACEAIFAPISDFEVHKREQWFEKSLAKNFERSLKMRKAWHAFHLRPLSQRERIIWIQQSQLKELNEKLWDIGGTEFFLYSLDDALSTHLEKHPEFGTLIYRNYKDRVLVTNLSDAEFKKKVLDPVLNHLAQEVLDLRYVSGWKPAEFWNYYIKNATQFSSAKSFEGAFLKLKLKRHKLEFYTWRKTVKRYRQHLLGICQESGVSWEQLLITAKEFKEQPAILRTKLSELGFSKFPVSSLLHYLDIISVGDFLPVPKVPSIEELSKIEKILTHEGSQSMENLARMKLSNQLTHGTWDYDRSLFLAEATKAKYILATDIRGLGSRGLLARDKWVAHGAYPQELKNVYAQTSQELKTQYEEIEKAIQNILGRKETIPQYVSGDDGLWALPEMSSVELKKLLDYLKTNHRIYSHLEMIEGENTPRSLANAIYQSRRALFDSKKK